MHHSVERRARGIIPQEGVGADGDAAHHYDEMCGLCHGAPGKDPSEIGQGLRPKPPDLAKVADHMSESTVFWVAKNGIRMTGMPAFGKTHSDGELWKMVSFVKSLPGMIRYVNEEEGNRFIYQPVFEFGIFPNMQWNLAGTFYSGNVDREGSGNVQSSLFYNFNTESLWAPATALAVEGDFPTGKRASGVDVTTKLILSKMPVVRSTLLHRLHLNLIWKHNAGRDPEEERSDLFKGVVGFSTRAGRDTTFILDYVREEKEEKHKEANIVEAGFRRQFTPFTLGTVGAGAGFGPDSERYRVTLGFQHTF